MQDDWDMNTDKAREWYEFLYEQHDFLRDQEFKVRDFRDVYADEPNQHDHCIVCRGRFGFFEDDFHIGYYYDGPPSTRWVCKRCFEHLQSMFRWSSKQTIED